MCGIAGEYIYAKGSVEERVLTRMRDVMFHRGPDGGANWISPDGRVGLAHRRLSILDLSAVASQPMPNEDETVWITFNGEIYNHLKLRDELVHAGHRFRTDHSDTEVLVHGYEQWGLDGLLSRIAGDYAFGIWDAARRVLSLARDRIGVKPLYFSPRRGHFLFGSEIKAILEHPSVTRELDPSAMYHYLSFMTTPAPLTMFKGIYKLPAGFRLQVQADGALDARRYWDAVPGHTGAASEVRGLSAAATEDFYVGEIRRRLREAVDCRMMSDVPFGVFLSGGIDSSTNVALMSQFTEMPVETFTVGFKDYTHLNELDEARLVANKFGTRHHEILIDEQDMIGYLNELVFHQDEPIADWVCIPLYFVSKLTHDSGVTVVQVGEGSDEQFCGYAGYMAYLDLYRRYWRPFRALLPKFARLGLAKAAGAAAAMRPSLEMYADILDRGARGREHFWSGATVFWDIMKRQLLRPGAFPPRDAPAGLASGGMLPDSYFDPDSFNVIRGFLEPFDSSYPGQDVLTRMIYNEFKLRLPELLLMRVDKVGMSVSLEPRVPFLDHRLVEFTMDIPMSWKTRGGVAKYLLKKASEGLIPDEIIYRKKMGFGAPMSAWLKNGFGTYAERTIMSSPLLDEGYFNPDYIRGLFADHRSGRRDNAVYIWTLFNLFAWHSYWIEGRQLRAASA
jgi:asparagine synthase (glutamine-hydrolysing)